MSAALDPHLSLVRLVVPRTPDGCEECDSSPLRHARADAVGHPTVQSFEPGENWRWCYADEAYA